MYAFYMHHPCVYICDGKNTIFECGEEKHKLGASKWQPNACDMAEQRWNTFF
jgi:hypothetical protein